MSSKLPRLLMAASLLATFVTTGCTPDPADDNPGATGLEASLPSGLPTGTTDPTEVAATPDPDDDNTADPEPEPTESTTPETSASTSPDPADNKAPDPSAPGFEVFGLTLESVTPAGSIIISDRSAADELRITFAVRDGSEPDNVLDGVTKLFNAVIALTPTVIVKTANGYAEVATLADVLAASDSAYSFTFYYGYSGMVVQATFAQRSQGSVRLTLADYTANY